MRRALTLAAVVAAGGLTLTLAALQAPIASPSPAALDATNIEKVKENLYLITGSSPTPRETFSGGNTGVFITDRGVVVVDTKLANWGPTILERIRTVTNQPIVTVINTPSHGDHTGSNEFVGAAVESVVHENTKANMARMDAFKDDKAQFLPKRTYADKLTPDAGKNQIDLHHFGAGHTNGDTFVVYTALRTMQASGMIPWKDAPFIDRSNGGSGGESRARYGRSARNIAVIPITRELVWGSPPARNAGTVYFVPYASSMWPMRACANALPKRFVAIFCAFGTSGPGQDI